MASRRRAKWREGDVVAIALGDGHWGFARVLKSPLMAFYEVRSREQPPIEDVVRASVLFKVWVMHRAVRDGIWPVIGNVPIEASLREEPRFFKVDPFTKKLKLHSDDGRDKPATREQVAGLECAAVWDPEHIVERLNDHFAQRPNRWVESMLPKP
jgi:hypothetical protein